MKWELDYVYRSVSSDLAPAVDVVWSSDTDLVIAFQNGLIEVVDVENRIVRSKTNFNEPIVGITMCDKNRLVVQSKSGSVSVWTIGEWKCLWSFSVKSAVSFAGPVVMENTVCFVSKGQSVLGFVDLETAQLITQLDLDSILNKPPGMIVALGISSSCFLALTEAGQIIKFSSQGKVSGCRQDLVVPRNSVPTALHVSGEVFVGFSDGSVFNITEGPKSPSAGVGAICSVQSELVVGLWDGRIQCVPPQTAAEDQPHIASIRSIAYNSLDRFAVASTDGRVSVWFI
jgi:WD40 repeat protein